MRADGAKFDQRKRIIMLNFEVVKLDGLPNDSLIFSDIIMSALQQGEMYY